MGYQKEQDEDMIRSEIYGEKKLRAVFTMEGVRDVEASLKAGYPIFRPVAYVLLRADGDRDCMSQPVTTAHKKQFSSEWARFDGAMKNPQSNIRALPTITQDVIKAFEELGIRTIEQLVAADVFDPVPMKPRVIDEDAEEWIEDEAVRGVPRPLQRWRDLGIRYMSLKAEAEGRTKPKLRLVDGHVEFAEAVA